jgi:hypothetical protein
MIEFPGCGIACVVAALLVSSLPVLAQTPEVGLRDVLGKWEDSKGQVGIFARLDGRPDPDAWKDIGQCAAQQLQELCHPTELKYEGKYKDWEGTFDPKPPKIVVTRFPAPADMATITERGAEVSEEAKRQAQDHKVRWRMELTPRKEDCDLLVLQGKWFPGDVQLANGRFGSLVEGKPRDVILTRPSGLELVIDKSDKTYAAATEALEETLAIVKETATGRGILACIAQSTREKIVMKMVAEDNKDVGAGNAAVAKCLSPIQILFKKPRLVVQPDGKGGEIETSRFTTPILRLYFAENIVHELAHALVCALAPNVLGEETQHKLMGHPGGQARLERIYDRSKELSGIMKSGFIELKPRLFARLEPDEEAFKLVTANEFVASVKAAVAAVRNKPR